MLLLNKRNKLIASGPIAMTLALVTFAMGLDEIIFVTTLQVMATIFLFFGIFKKDPQHKDMFLLFWLGITTILFGVYCYWTIYFLITEVFCDVDELLDTFLLFLLFLVMVAATALLAYLMHCVYEEFAELRSTKAVTTTTPMVNEAHGFVKTKDVPPSYLSTNNLTVSIQN